MSPSSYGRWRVHAERISLHRRSCAQSYRVGPSRTNPIPLACCGGVPALREAAAFAWHAWLSPTSIVIEIDRDTDPITVETGPLQYALKLNIRQNDRGVHVRRCADDGFPSSARRSVLLDTFASAQVGSSEVGKGFDGLKRLRIGIVESTKGTRS